jgi:hypothetical protein
VTANGGLLWWLSCLSTSQIVAQEHSSRSPSHSTPRSTELDARGAPLEQSSSAYPKLTVRSRPDDRPFLGRVPTLGLRQTGHTPSDAGIQGVNRAKLKQTKVPNQQFLARHYFANLSFASAL